MHRRPPLVLVSHTLAFPSVPSHHSVGSRTRLSPSTRTNERFRFAKNLLLRCLACIPTDRLFFFKVSIFMPPLFFSRERRRLFLLAVGPGDGPGVLPHPGLCPRLPVRRELLVILAEPTLQIEQILPTPRSSTTRALHDFFFW